MKGQVAFEFTSLVIMIMFLLVTVGYVVTNQIITANKDLVESRTQEVLLRVNEELSLASNVANGYNRTFDLPYHLHGQEYNITIQSSRLFVQSGALELEKATLNITGTIQKGTNRITKKNNTICMNTIC